MYSYTLCFGSVGPKFKMSQSLKLQDDDKNKARDPGPAPKK